MTDSTSPPRRLHAPEHAQIDTDRASVARVYDYLLGGTENYAVDREAGDALIAAMPDTPLLAKANRAFVRQAVRFLVGRAGIRQIIDIGSGLPTAGNVHDVAHEIDPAVRVVYVDNDPTVLVHGGPLLSAHVGTTLIEGDVRDPDAIFDHPETRRLIDFSEPFAVLLGGILMRPQLMHVIVDLIADTDFYLPAHATIFRAFLDLYRKSAPIDLISTAEQLKSNNALEEAGGAVYLADLAQAVVSGANAEYYATIVRDKSLQRGLINACSSIISNCYDASREVGSLLDESEQAVFSISERTSGKVFKSSKELVNRVFEELTKRFEQKEAVTGVTTGYNRLDQMTAGLQPSDLIIVAARPSMGKTAFALNMAMRAAVQDNVPVAIYSLEMSMDQLMMRMLCA